MLVLRLRVWGVLAVIAVLGVTSAVAQSAGPAADSAKTTTIVDQVLDAWNKHDVALVLARLSVKSAQGSGQPDKALATFVLVKVGGAWRITALEIASGGPAPSAKK